MSKVISFLETVGQDAQLRHATNNEMELALTSAQIEPELQAAIMGGDKSQLELLLGARINVVCAVAGPNPDKPDDEDDEESPIPDDDEITLSRVALRRIA